MQILAKCNYLFQVKPKQARILSFSLLMLMFIVTFARMQTHTHTHTYSGTQGKTQVILMF